MSLIIENPEDLAAPVFWVWKCRDCKKEYPEKQRFSTFPYKCNCGGVVDLCVAD